MTLNLESSPSEGFFRSSKFLNESDLTPFFIKVPQFQLSSKIRQTHNGQTQPTYLTDIELNYILSPLRNIWLRLYR